MMNENSPICARLIPVCTDVRGELPTRNVPTDTASTLPAITTAVTASTAPQCRMTSAGFSSIPTATKNTATNTSRTGCTRCSTTFSSPDSAISEPAMKAPSTTE
jgi:hypothetical protein